MTKKSSVSFQKKLCDILDGSSYSPISKFIEYFIITVVILNVLMIILESVKELSEVYASFFYSFEVFSVLVFTIEYVLRVWSYGAKYHVEGAWKGRKEYIFSFYGLIDFFATAPFYLQLLFPGSDLRFLRVFRLLRIFKLSRYNSALQDLGEAVIAERESFYSAMFLLLIACLLFSSLIYIAEGQAQPEIFGSIPLAMKWFLMTIIAGWGGTDPTTGLGSFLIIVTQLIAIMLAAILTGVVATAYNAQVTRREAQYETLVREVLADGVVDAEEQEELDQLKKKFGMTDEQVEMIAEQVRVENEEKEEKAKFLQEQENINKKQS